MKDPAEKRNLILLLIIVITGSILRLIHPLAIPYNLDELSALIRTQFGSLSELLNKGVKLDAHPPLVQVFLFYWVKLFGFNEFAIKLPFIICGMLSIFYTYRICREWFNATTGLVCASYIATLEYCIMYSQTARPYISGLFFILAMVFYWDKLLFRSPKSVLKYWLLFVLFSSLSAYNHHFSLLMAGIIAASGLFFIRKDNVIKYLGALLAIILLYIPNLPIFFYQLKVGGVGGKDGWLGKPHYDFIIYYIKFVFHFSTAIYALVGVLFLSGLFYMIRSHKKPGKFVLLSFFWFILPLLIGFLYSTFINPVLQYSVLIFSFPFFLCCLFGMLPEFEFRINTALIFVICSLNIFTLVNQRHYYSLFYKSPYEQTLIQTDSIKKSPNADNTVSIIQSRYPLISNYYIKKDKLTSSFAWLNSFKDNPSFDEYLANQKSTYLSVGCIDSVGPETIGLILNYYPYIIKQTNYFGGTFYIFSKNIQNGSSPNTFVSENGFEKPVDKWARADSSLLSDTVVYSGKHSYLMKRENQYSPGFSSPMAEIVSNNLDMIYASVEFCPVDTMMDDVYIVSEIKSNGKVVDWRSSSLKEYMPKGTGRRWIKAYHGIKLSDIYLSYPDLKITIYIWNKGKKMFYIDNFKVTTIKGNPLIYGMFEKI